MNANQQDASGLMQPMSDRENGCQQQLSVPFVQNNDMKEMRAKQDQLFRQSMSSMKNQINEVIKEDVNESVRSNTYRNLSQDKHSH